MPKKNTVFAQYVIQKTKVNQHGTFVGVVIIVTKLIELLLRMKMDE